MHDIKKASEKLRSYLDKIFAENTFDPADMRKYMDGVFTECGFRALRGSQSAPEILVVRNDAAGDFVLFTGLLREIRRIYKNAHITLLASEKNKELAQCCPYIDNIEFDALGSFNSNDTKTALINAVETGIKLMKYNFDIAFSFRLGIKSCHYISAYLSGATHCIGFDQDRPDIKTGQKIVTGWNNFLTEIVPVPTENMQDAERNFAILEHMLKAPIQDKHIEVWYTPEEGKIADSLLKPILDKGLQHIIAVCPGASIKTKMWPIERFIKFFSWVIEKDPLAGLVILGGPKEQDVCQQLYNAFPDKSINIAGKTNFRISAACVDRTHIYIGNDTGLLHIASAFKKPVLATSCYPVSIGMRNMSVPIRFYPYQVPHVVLLPPTPADDCNGISAYGCEKLNECHCIKGITVDMMKKGYQALMERISKNETTPFYLTDHSKIKKQ